MMSTNPGRRGAMPTRSTTADRPNVRPQGVVATAMLLIVTTMGCASDQGSSTKLSNAAPSVRTANVAATSKTPRAENVKLPDRLFYTLTTAGDVQSMNVTDARGSRQLLEPGVACCVLRASPTKDQVFTLPADFTAPLTGATFPSRGHRHDLTPLPRTDPTLNLVPSAWSPDGRRIAFEGWDDNDPTRTGIYTARLKDGSDLVRVTRRTDVPHDTPLDYSPDGKRILYFRSTHPDPDYSDGSLWVVNTDGTHRRRITTEQTLPNVWARWSPDGTRIVFAAERLADRGPIWTVSPDGTNLTTVYEDADGRFAGYPDWSPDGSRIVFTLNPTNDEYAHVPNSVYVMSAHGTRLRLVDDRPTFKRAMEWVSQ